MSEPTPSASSAKKPSPQAASISSPSWRWGVSLLIAAAASWVWLDYTPIQFQPPEELLAVDMYSPPDVQEAAAEKTVELYWKNSFAQLIGVGFCFGAVALLTSLGPGAGQRWVPILVGLISGVVCGALMAVLGTYLRRYVNSIDSLPLVNETNRLLVTDTCVFMFTTALLALPIGLIVLFGGGKQRVQKAVSIVLAGVVTGLLTPIAVSAAVHTSQTNEFPPIGMALTAIWLIVLAGLVFVFSTSTGTRSKKGKSNAQEAAA